MTDPASLVALSATGLAAIGLVSAAALRAWTGWLELRRLAGPRAGPAPVSPRPDLAELRKRVRRLEAIANGVEA